MTTQKLTPAMRRVLDKMKEGWTLEAGVTSFDSRAHLRGPASSDGWERTNGNTIQALYDRGLLGYRYSFPVAKYVLTEKGRNA